MATAMAGYPKSPVGFRNPLDVKLGFAAIGLFLGDR